MAAARLRATRAVDAAQDHIDDLKFSALLRRGRLSCHTKD
jgi:hypothetical protein